MNEWMDRDRDGWIDRQADMKQYSLFVEHIGITLMF